MSIRAELCVELSDQPRETNCRQSSVCCSWEGKHWSVCHRVPLTSRSYIPGSHPEPEPGHWRNILVLNVDYNLQEKCCCVALTGDKIIIDILVRSQLLDDLLQLEFN